MQYAISRGQLPDSVLIALRGARLQCPRVLRPSGRKIGKRRGSDCRPVLQLLILVAPDILPALLIGSVFLLVQSGLLLLRDVAAVLRRHVALFLPDLMIFLMQLLALRRRQLAAFHFPGGFGVFMIQALVHFGAARMGFVEFGCRRGAERGAHQKRKSHGRYY
ncbi:MAG TPA: hypothetical protein VMT94_01230 [Burkholderiales bacterium]|nr:hypothetical protein [Burkholderiales bacterium]